MKKTTYTIMLLLALTVTACGASNGSNRAAGQQNGPSAQTLPATTQLIVGTLKLEGTNQAVTARQAADLVPLWQTMQVLSDSDTAADQEKGALIAQIQETMTTEQMQAITEMNLTGEDLFAVMREQGMAMGRDSQNSNSQSGNSSRSGGGFEPGAGGPPGGMSPDERGGPGAGGGFGGQGQNASQSQIATAQASRQQNENFIPPALLKALIEYLEKKASS